MRVDAELVGSHDNTPRWMLTVINVDVANFKITCCWNLVGFIMRCPVNGHGFGYARAKWHSSWHLWHFASGPACMGRFGCLQSLALWPGRSQFFQRRAAIYFLKHFDLLQACAMFASELDFLGDLKVDVCLRCDP